MLIYNVIFCIFLIVNSIENFVLADEYKLELLNVVFRHGHRTPEKNTVYPNDPYVNNTYYPEGYGALIDEGKKKAHKLGQELRMRYSSFLNNYYVPSDLYTRSTNFHRSKMTLQLVLTGLYPPKDVQVWHKRIQWQPIPVDYVPNAEDDLYIRYFTCKKFNENYKKSQQTTEMKNKIDSFKPLIKKVEESTGRKITDIFQLYGLQSHLAAQMEMKLKLPEWSKDIFPIGALTDAAVTTLNILNYSNIQKKFLGGSYLRKVIDNIMAVTNKTIENPGRQIYLYSGHDTNIASVISAFNFKNEEIPYYTSAIVIELRSKNNNYFVKVVKYNGKGAFSDLQIPGCNIMCPLQDFLKLTSNVIPTNEDLKCD